MRCEKESGQMSSKLNEVYKDDCTESPCFEKAGCFRTEP